MSDNKDSTATLEPFDVEKLLVWCVGDDWQSKPDKVCEAIADFLNQRLDDEDGLYRAGWSDGHAAGFAEGWDEGKAFAEEENNGW